MEMVNEMEDSDSDNEIFFGPITKREIMSKLKHYSLCSDKFLKPLETFQGSDVLDDSLIQFYYTNVFPKGGEDNNSENCVETKSSTMKDSEHSISLSESQLLGKHVVSFVENKSVWRNEEQVNTEELISLNSTPVSIHSTPEKSNSLSSTIDLCSLNCTLQEMEMLMKFGENYMNRSVTPPESVVESCSVARENTLQTPPELVVESYSVARENKLQITNAENNESIKCTPFKIPTRVCAKKSPNYKNIVSPIAVYINSTPKVPLVQNVATKTVHAPSFREPVSRWDEQLKDGTANSKPVLPVRSYKPAARTVLLSEEPESTVPGSIRKLVKGRLNPVVIKHMGRVNTNTAPCDDDFTILSSSSTVQADVSLHVVKNAARTNRLQQYK